MLKNSAIKIYFFPGQRKNCEKFFPIFFTFRSGKLSEFALFWEKLSRLGTTSEKIKSKKRDFGPKGRLVSEQKLNLQKRSTED